MRRFVKETHAREGAVYPLNGSAKIAASRILSHAKTNARIMNFTDYFARRKTSVCPNGARVKINVSTPIGKSGDPGTIFAMRRRQNAGCNRAQQDRYRTWA